MRKAVIIVAGGSGSRMKSNIPKQFIELEGIPVLMHTIKKFYNFDPDIEIVVVLPKDQIIYWKELIQKYKFTIHHQIVHGGTTRFYSVKNGISALESCFLIGIHDGVRPFVSDATLKRSYEIAEASGNAIPALPVKESIRWVDEKHNKPMERENIWSIQTPQVFHGELIKKAFEQEYQTSFTDDASVLEAAGHSINIVKGNPENIKITEKIDLIFASALLTNNI